MNHPATIFWTALLAGVLFCCLPDALAAQSVTDSLDLNKGAAADLSDLVRGQVSGVMAGDNTFHIRGLNAVRGMSRPLVVIDGVWMGEYELYQRDAFFQYDNAPAVESISNLLGLAIYEIESIEVLKDISATAIYGSRGANGVIRVTSRLPRSESAISRADWSSNAVGSFEDGRLSVGHNHQGAFSGSFGRTTLRISAFYRDTDRPAEGSEGRYYGMNAGLDARGNKTIWFGGRLAVDAGKVSLQGDGDDDSEDYGGRAYAWGQVNFTPWLHWRTEGGLNVRSLSRILWYGRDTWFGAAHDGVASNVYTRSVSWNGESAAEADLYTSRGRLKARAGVSLSGRDTYFNTLTGDTFFSEAMRGYGLSAMGSALEPHRYDFQDKIGGGFVSADYMGNDGGYGVTALLRADCTDRYEKPFHWYPAVNAFADLRKIAFPQGRTVSALRLEAGWGVAGNSEALPLDYSQMFQQRGPVVEREGRGWFYPFSYLRSREWNAGVRAGLFSDRVDIGVKAYDKTTADNYSVCAFGDRPGDFWHSADGRIAWRGADATIANRGIETDFSAEIIKSASMSWHLDARYSYNDYEVTAASLDALEAASAAASVPSSLWGAGSSLTLGRLTLDAQADGVEGSGSLNYVRLSRITLSWDAPTKGMPLVHGLRANLSGCNLCSSSDTKLPWLQKGVVAGVSLKF